MEKEEVHTQTNAVSQTANTVVPGERHMESVAVAKSDAQTINSARRDVQPVIPAKRDADGEPVKPEPTEH
tara:strand:+ start:8469 stop:8678 length:210 start_codon:yes stop_codon:yes gene_type:complete